MLEGRKEQSNEMAVLSDAGWCFHDDSTFHSTFYTVELGAKTTGYPNDTTRDNYTYTCKYGKTNRPESDGECAIRNARQ